MIFFTFCTFFCSHQAQNSLPSVLVKDLIALGSKRVSEEEREEDNGEMGILKKGQKE